MAMPRHVAISLDNIFDWCRRNNAEISDGCNKYFGFLVRLLEQQVKSKIPIFTIYLLPDSEPSDDYIVFSIMFFSDSTTFPGRLYHFPNMEIFIFSSEISALLDNSLKKFARHSQKMI